jgi:hypothetical protein
MCVTLKSRSEAELDFFEGWRGRNGKARMIREVYRPSGIAI